MALFTLTEVEYSVPAPQGKQRQLLAGINLRVEAGALFTIIGPSGAGKSSLLHLLNRLCEPTGGQITYAGLPLHAYEVTQLRREVGMLLQKPYMLPGTVRSNILAGPQLSGIPAIRTPEELLTLVGLEPAILQQEARNLSGGEQQRLSLARLLANNPRVVLLDEPTASLNQAAAEELEQLIRCLVSQDQLTVIMVTHDLEQARRLGSTTALIAEGRVVECLPTEQFFTGAGQEFTMRYLEENWQQGGTR